MMPGDELLGCKARLMRSAQLALAISGLNSEESLEFEPREYAEAIACLAAMPDDLASVLAELDVLRGMFEESVHSFLKGHKEVNHEPQTKLRKKKKVSPAPSEEQADGGDGETDSHSGSSEPMPTEQPESSSESEQDDDAPVNKRPRGRRSSGKRTKRPKPRGDSGEGETDS